MLTVPRQPLATMLTAALSVGLSIAGPLVPSGAAASSTATEPTSAVGTCCLEGIKREFNLRTPELIFGGYGTAEGVVAFQSRRRAVVSASVTDWCDNNPGDGLGAGLYVDVLFGDGTGKPEYLYGDFNGCTNNTASGTHPGHSVPNPQSKRIVAVQMLLCYEDPDDAGVACVKLDRSRVIDNPYG